MLLAHSWSSILLTAPLDLWPKSKSEWHYGMETIWSAPTYKDLWINIDKTSIPHFHIRSISDWHRSNGLWYWVGIWYIFLIMQFFLVNTHFWIFWRTHWNVAGCLRKGLFDKSLIFTKFEYPVKSVSGGCVRAYIIKNLQIYVWLHHQNWQLIVSEPLNFLVLFSVSGWFIFFTEFRFLDLKYRNKIQEFCIFTPMWETLSVQQLPIWLVTKGHFY